jgi:hypothetical protein
MKPPWKRRLVATLAALFFTLGAGRESLGVGCPHHADAAHSSHNEARSPEAAHEGSHQAGGTHRGTTDQSSPVKCTCIGTCQAGAAPLASSDAGQVAAGGEGRAASGPANRSLHLTRFRFLLPYATAPPQIH